MSKKKHNKPAVITKLDLSYGELPKDFPYSRPDGFDPMKLPWPFKDGSVEEANSSFLLQRLPKEQRGPWMDELHRVLVKGGKCTMIVPYWTSARSVQDPMAEWPPLSENSFLYFNKKFREDNKLDYKFTCDFDFCVSPETLILKSDLTWVSAAEIRQDDKLVGVDEFRPGSGAHRRMLECSVESVSSFEWDRCSVHTDQGSIVVTPEHPFLCRRKFSSGRLGTAGWIPAAALQVGHSIKFVSKPWVARNGDSWIAGIIDGEGCICLPDNTDKYTGLLLTISQNPGPVLDRIISTLKGDFGDRVSVSKKGRNLKCHVAYLGGISDSLRAVGMYRPIRLLPKLREIVASGKLGLPNNTAVVKRVEPEKTGPVVAIRTSSRTLITNGLVSHNSYGYDMDPEIANKNDEVRGFGVKRYLNAINNLHMVLVKR